MPKLPKKVITFKRDPFHTKISTPTGTAVPVEKSKKFPPKCYWRWILSLEKLVPSYLISEISLPVLCVPPPICHIDLGSSSYDKLQFPGVENCQKSGVDHFVETPDQWLSLGGPPPLQPPLGHPVYVVLGKRQVLPLSNNWWISFPKGGSTLIGQ